MAQDRVPAPPATPRPAHERLTVFGGTWTTASPQEGRTFRETCDWLPGGRRHMVCRPRSESPSGATEQLTVYSYRGADSTYIVTAFLATGQVWRYLGRPDGDRWVFDLESRRADSAQRLRMVITPRGDSIRFVEESSENSGPWSITEDYTRVRIRNRPQ